MFKGRRIIVSLRLSPEISKVRLLLFNWLWLVIGITVLVSAAYFIYLHHLLHPALCLIFLVTALQSHVSKPSVLVLLKAVLRPRHCLRCTRVPECATLNQFTTLQRWKEEKGPLGRDAGHAHVSFSYSCAQLCSCWVSIAMTKSLLKKQRKGKLTDVCL